MVPETVKDSLVMGIRYVINHRTRGSYHVPLANSSFR